MTNKILAAAPTFLAASFGVLAQNSFPPNGPVYVGNDQAAATVVEKRFSTAHASGNVPSSISFGMYDGSPAGMNIKDFQDGAYNSQTIEFLTHHGGSSAGVRMTIDKAGLVGIGTTTPLQQLTLTGGIGFANQNAADKKLYSPIDGVLEWMTHDLAAGKGFAVSHQGEHRVFLGSLGNSFFNGGNVGIGTTTPQSSLDVVGTTRSANLRLTGGPESGSYILSSERIHIQAENNNGLHLNPFGGPVLVNAITPSLFTVGGNAEFRGTVSVHNLTNVGNVFTGGRMHVQAGEHLYLNPFPGSGDVVVGGGGGIGHLVVAGKTTTQTLELTSDRHQKAGFASVDPADLLHRVTELPVTTWHYTNSPAVRHIGPMAQDFKKAFPLLSADGQHINAGDGLGVALAAIQGLNQKLEAQIKKKEARIAALETQVEAMGQRLTLVASFLEKGGIHNSKPANGMINADRESIDAQNSRHLFTDPAE